MFGVFSEEVFLSSAVLTDTILYMVTTKTTAQPTQEADQVKLSTPSLSDGVKAVAKCMERMASLPAEARGRLEAHGLNIADATEPTDAQKASETRAFGEMIGGKSGLSTPLGMEAIFRALRKPSNNN